MKIREVMTQNVRTCRPDQGLNAAAQVMWDNDCGCVPIVDDQSRIVGMLTDRDIAMAAYTQGVPLSASPISSAMSKHVYACSPDDTATGVEQLMRKMQVRRIPVTDREGRLIGLVSLGDIARRMRTSATATAEDVTPTEVAQTLAAISARTTAQAAE